METENQDSAARALLQHATWLRRLAGALVGDSATADDLAQETWVAALSSGVDSSRPLKPWLRRVATNFAHKSFLKRERSSSAPLDERTDSNAIDPAELTERLEHESHLTEALSRLDEPFRSTLYLRYYEGLAPKTIATRTKTAPGTVRWRLKRGLELMRERLDSEVEGGRSSWMAMFIPLAGLGPKTTTAVASGVALSSSPAMLFGVLAMSTLFKLLAVLAAGVVLYVGLETGGVLPASLSMASNGEVPIEVEFRAIDSVPEGGVRPAKPPTEVAAPEDETRSAVDLQAREPLAKRTTRVAARVTDEFGEPIGRARAYSNRHAIELLTDEDGKVLLSVERGEEPTMDFVLNFAKEGRTSISRSLELGLDPEYDFGEIQLKLGGIVSGRIVDSDGRGIEGATINWLEGSMPGRRLESMRFGSIPASFPSCAASLDGTFELSGVPVSFIRLWASAPGFEPQYTSAIEVRARYESRGVNITLPKLKPENHILLRVLNPTGEPVPNADLNFRYEISSLGTSMQGTRTTDQEGRYEFVLKDDARLWVNASDPDSKFGTSALQDIQTGPEEILLRLTEPLFGTLTVTRSDRTPVGEFELEVRSADGELAHENITVAATSDGIIQYRLPASDFLLRVTAPLAEIEELGPLAPSKTKTLSMRLSPVPGMHGTIMAEGEPLANADVSLHGTIPSDTSCSINGFRCSSRRQPVASTRTDEQGRFVLTIREPGAYIVRAEAERYAPADTTPFTIEADLQSAAIELELGRGGTLEGEVRTGTSESPADSIVGISRGDGYARTMRVGHDGKFRFEGLTPGLWSVAPNDSLLIPGTISISKQIGSRVVPFESLEWNCEIVEGQTTFHAVGLDGTANWSFDGHFSLSGDTSLAWTARLLAPERFFVEDSPGAVALGTNGDFKLPVHDLGQYQLVLRTDLGPGLEFFVVQPVDVAAASPWLLDLQVGELQLDGIPQAVEAQAPSLVLLRELPDQGFALVSIQGNESGQAIIELAPAGKCQLVKPNLREGFDPRKWEVVAEVEVVRGGSTHLKL